MKKLLFISLTPIAFVLIFTSACKNKTVSDPAETEAVTESTFGAPVEGTAGAKSFDEVAGLLDGADSVRTVLKAKVSDVCQAKGCWMSIVDPVTDSEESIFVQFQDYGFFVPKDIAGREVIIEGVAYRQETTVDELRHYAEDAGKTAEEIAAITEPVVEKKFMATGVVLLK